ncbi:nicotinate-nucleotide--dimethylbenzimidazole phosphoribosyltransferase [Streptomyces sp. NPDC052701]|uniref:nicotinate-nucleotide--dimethylbenzimidazole phosphoribosyltransferase n=1 Tax=Streptomyces sp. NPDC052701 TaxID=3155533 RepID=UPI003428EBC0
MTDTGQVPGEGLPENAGMVEQPGVPAPGAYTYLSESPAEDEDLLLPGHQGAWGTEVAPPAPEPVVEAVHEPGPHELSGRDSGSVDLGGVRLPDPAPAPVPPRRPLHLGPPIPDTSASPVRSLADRGPADAPVRQPGPPAAGPEYLDAPGTRPAPAQVPPQGAAPWGAQAAAQAPVSAGAAPAETVVPAAEPAGAAQALVARVATGAGAATEPGAAQAGQPAEAGHAVPHAPAAQPADGAHPAQPPHGTQATGLPAGQAYDPQAGQAPGAEVPYAANAGQGADGVPADDAGHGFAEGSPEAAAPGAADLPADEAGQELADVSGRAPHPVSGTPVPDAGQAPGAAEAPEAAAAPEDAQASDGAPGAEPPSAAEGGEVPGPAGPAPVVDGPQAAAQAPDASGPEDIAPEGVAPEGVAPGASDPGAAAQAPDAAAADAVPHVHGTVAPGTAVDEPAPTEQVIPEAAAPAPDPTAVATDPEPTTPEPTTPEPTAPVPAPQPTAVPQAAEATEAAPFTAAAPAAADAARVPQPAEAAPAPAEAVPAPAEAAPAPAEAAPAPTEAVPAAAPGPSPAQTGPEPAAQEQGEQSVPEVQPPHTPEPGRAAQPVQGPQQAHALQPAPDVQASLPVQPAPLEAGAPVADGTPAAPVPDGAATAPARSADDGFPATADRPEQPVGRFVPVEGPVPAAPHLAPAPPQAAALPAQARQAPEPAAGVPAPRGAQTGPDPEPVQNAEDLDTRAADQEDPEHPEHPEHQGEESTAAVAEARQSTGPAAPPYDDAEREAVLKVMRERRDIRNGFRNDPIPHEVLLRVLEAAHTAPSVGHSQPWDFVVIRSADTRRAMHELAVRQREAYAKSLPKGRAKQFKELKIEAILDTPVNIVVTADPTRGGRHTLGRHTQPQMAPYSAALAVENLWLAARAEGLGVGWVSFFDEREMVRVLGLPEHLEVIAYLCVGYVDEFPDEPELMQAGWSKRRPLSWVVHEETYGRRALPGEEPHDLLAETVAQIRPLDAKALGEAWERQKRMTKPAGALGMLEIISAQLSGLSRQCPPPIPEPAAVAIFAGDHGVHAQGVTPWPQEVTGQMVANFLGGGAVCNAFATQVGAEVCVVDVGVAADLPATPGLLPRKIRAGTSDMTAGPAMTREEARKAIEIGIETARDLVAAGNRALLTGEMGIANTTASAALISVFTSADPAEVTGRGTGINDETLARKTEVVRRAIELHRPDPADPIGVLAAVGGFEHAAMVGLLLGGASLRTPVILDGVSAGAAALVARAIAPEVLAACIAGHRSAEPGHVAALNKLGLRPLVDLDLRLGEGTGALLALPLVQSTARAMHEVATFDSAGVTEK